MGCVKLLQGLDLTCQDSSQKFYQQIVLINRSDVDQSYILDTEENHRISFNLFPDATGRLFMGNESASTFSASFAKTRNKGIPYYNHQLQLPIIGTDEEIKIILKQIDLADVFAAIQLTNGTVEIYGFENGLTTGNYNYQPQGAIGGAVIPLDSTATENVPPYIYYGNGMENEHFNNLFAGIAPLTVIGGDFNADFNDDFNNTETP